MKCVEFQAVGAEAVGIYYINDSSAGTPCDMPDQVGSPTAQALVVVNEFARMNTTVFYGMLFVRSDHKNGQLTITGQAKVFGSLVVEGTTNGKGNPVVVFDPTNTSSPGKKLPSETRLARLSGSWLDSDRGGF